MEPESSKEGPREFRGAAGNLAGAHFSSEMSAIAASRRELTQRLQHALLELMSGRVPAAVAVEHWQDLTINARDLNLQLVIEGRRSGDAGGDQAVRLICWLEPAVQRESKASRKSERHAAPTATNQLMIELVDDRSQDMIASYVNEWPQDLKFVDVTEPRSDNLRKSRRSTTPISGTKRKANIDFLEFESKEFFRWFRSTEKSLTNDERRSVLGRWLAEQEGLEIATLVEKQAFVKGVREAAKDVGRRFKISFDKTWAAAQFSCRKMPSAPEGLFYFSHWHEGANHQLHSSTKVPKLVLCKP